MNRQLTLLLPGLLGIAGRSPDQAAVSALPASGLLAFLSKARGVTYDTRLLADALWDLFALSPQQHKPIASLTRLADCGAAAGLWTRADPVHLRADRDDVVLSSLGRDSPSGGETRELLDLINDYFTDDGLHFDAPHPRRWYLAAQCMTMPDPEELAGQHIQHLMAPAQADRRWVTIMNEIQMLLHNSEVNHQRSERGLPVINSLWLWGGGQLPDPGHPGWTGVWTDHPLAAGLAHHHAVALHPVPDLATEWLDRASSGNHLLVLDHCYQQLLSGSIDRWGASLTRLSDDWLEPLLNALMQGRLQRLCLMPLNGSVYELGQGRFRRRWPWRKKPVLSDYFDQAKKNAP